MRLQGLHVASVSQVVRTLAMQDCEFPERSVHYKAEEQSWHNAVLE
jgi:hypothetical protein